MTVSESLRSLRGNERPRANRSGHARQMSDRERFAQSLRGNEQMSNSLNKFWLKNLKSCFSVCFIYNIFIEKMSESLISSFFGKQCE